MNKIVYAALLVSLVSGAAIAQTPAPIQVPTNAGLVADASDVATALAAAPNLVTELTDLENNYPPAIKQYQDFQTNLAGFFNACSATNTQCDTGVPAVQAAVTAANAALGLGGNPSPSSSATLIAAMPAAVNATDFLSVTAATQIASTTVGIPAIAAQLQIGENQKATIQGLMGATYHGGKGKGAKK